MRTFSHFTPDFEVPITRKIEYLPLQWWLATVFQAGDPGTAVMKIDPKQMSVNNEAEANL